MIYFDNAATTNFKPVIVKNAVNDAMEKYCANPSRSSHIVAIETMAKIHEARERVAEFFGVKNSSRVIFAQNCTTAINMALLGLLNLGDHVITTNVEHNSVLRPLHMLSEKKYIELSIVSCDSRGTVNVESIKKEVKQNTRIVIVNHISNVTGAKNDIRKIGEFCHENGLIFMIDAAQSAGHTKIDMQKDNIDILCFAGHKGLYALTGIGGLCLSDSVEIKPVIYGGTGVDSANLTQDSVYPDNFESGTISVPLIMSLSSGIEYVMKNFDLIQNRINSLQEYLIYKLQTIKNIQMYSKLENCHGVVTFNLYNKNCHEVGNYLNENYQICVRTGLHCAPLIHKYLGTLESGGAVRVSINHKNTFEEIDTLILALKEFNSK